MKGKEKILKRSKKAAYYNLESQALSHKQQDKDMKSFFKVLKQYRNK